MVNENLNRKTKKLHPPLNREDALSLEVGDWVLISGHIITGRDKVHKFFFTEKPEIKGIPFNLKGAVLYHCGPIIKKTEEGYKLIAGGPTTSIRVEMYEHQMISQYGIRAVMGKGGMGRKTLDALKVNGCVYLNTVSGAAVYLADRVKRVVDVWRPGDFGMAEAMWVFEVEEFPAMVTMDAHGRSLHEEIEKMSYKGLKRLLGLP